MDKYLQTKQEKQMAEEHIYVIIKAIKSKRLEKNFETEIDNQIYES